VLRTLAGIWFTVITVNISLVYLASSLVWMSLMNLMLVYMFNLFTLMTGLWVTLQFHWIVRENPKTAIVMFVPTRPWPQSKLDTDARAIPHGSISRAVLCHPRVGPHRHGWPDRCAGKKQMQLVELS